MTLYLLKHEVGTRDCAPGWHCHIHHVDEWKPYGYLGCGECGHLFPRR